MVKSSQHDDFEGENEARDGRLEESSVCRMEKKRLEKTLLEKKVSMKAKRRFVVDSERTANLLETEKGLLLKKNNEPVSCLSQTAMSVGKIMDKLLKYIPLQVKDFRSMLRKQLGGTVAEKALSQYR